MFARNANQDWKAMDKAPHPNYFLSIPSTCCGFCHALDAMRQAAGLVDFNHDAVQDDAIFCDFEPLRHAGQETLNNRSDFPPKDAFVRPGETSIAQKGCAAG